ncbi:MAG: hypothetical protein DBX52_07585 [Clostridiales bacterium]|nr:MAG: hypothetical protein DBX52_07585 [Clostridiales bacterium]
MPELGGLKEIPDVKALILYLLKEAGCVVRESQLTDILMADGLVEYFDYSQAMEQLLMAGMMDIASLDETGSYRITRQGLEVEAEYEQRLPYNVKSKTLAALRLALRQKQEEEQVWAEIGESESGYTVTCTIQERGEVMLSYRLLVPERKDAYYVAERFRENPAGYYQKIMEVVLDENLFRKGD